VWVSAPQAHSRVSNINFDNWFFFMEGGLYKYPMLHKSKSNIKVDIWSPATGLRCRNPLRHFSLLKTRAIPLTRPLGVYVKGIIRAFNWPKCLGGFLHLKPTTGCQISTLIFDFFYGGGSLLISHSKYIFMETLWWNLKKAGLKCCENIQNNLWLKENRQDQELN
jgi:hypothetical protein